MITIQNKGITNLDVDAIVNAANAQLQAGGGIFATFSCIMGAYTAGQAIGPDVVAAF